MHLVVLRVEILVLSHYHSLMEKRITTLEVLAEQTQKSIDRLDRSITGLRSDMESKFAAVDNKFIEVDRKFTWMISIQFTTLIAILGLFAKMANIY